MDLRYIDELDPFPASFTLRFLFQEWHVHSVAKDFERFAGEEIQLRDHHRGTPGKLLGKLLGIEGNNNFNPDRRRGLYC